MKFIDKIKRNKLLYFLGVLIVGIFIVLIVRFTYAYLALNVNEARGDVTLNSDETDKLDFVVGDPLSIDATPTTLPENGENLVDTTTAKATLLANSTNDTAEYSYWVYFTISNNTFVYSDGSTPEIILTVTDPTGNPVTNIDGLTYGTFNGVAGFDVTTANGVFAVASDYAITSSSSTIATEQTWNFTLTYLNQSYDQSANYGNSMTTEIKMQKEKNKVVFADYITSQVYTGVDGENDLYYHDGVGTYTNADQEAGDNSYRYSGANPNNYVCFGSDEDSCPYNNLYRIIGLFENDSNNTYNVKLIKNDYTTVEELGTNGDYITTYYTAQTTDGVSYENDYYKGKNDLSMIGTYCWDCKWQEPNWSISNFNIVNLNTNFINTFSMNWQNKIYDYNWPWHGWLNGSFGDLKVSDVYYEEIITTSAFGSFYNAKIGLMYVSDYGYATIPENWMAFLYNYNNSEIRDNNWMFMGLMEYTLTPDIDFGDNWIHLIASNGKVSGYYPYDNIQYYGTAIRPTFYLNSDVAYISGTGTKTDPYRIA